MKTSLKAGLNEEENKRLEASYTAGRFFIERLKLVLNNKIKESYESSIKKANYDIPSWDRLQADGIGYQRALKEVLSLLFDKK